MKILKPKVIRPAKVESPQCCVVVEQNPGTQWRIDRYKKLRPKYDPYRCQQPASYEIDGKFYCTSHAGKLALEKWIVGDLVEAIPSYDKADGY